MDLNPSCVLSRVLRFILASPCENRRGGCSVRGGKMRDGHGFEERTYR